MLRDNYPEIDSNMSDSNIGARKGRNIRDHTFVINGVIAETLATKGAATELIIDYSKCFDVQDVDITTNDMFECGVDSDQLNLMYECDAYSKVAVKTPVGLTSRVDLPPGLHDGPAEVIRDGGPDRPGA